MTLEAEKPAGIEEFSEKPEEGISRSRRIGGKTFPTEPTVFKANSRQFGEVLLRKEWYADLSEMTPQDRLKFIRAGMQYAVVSGRIDILLGQLEEHRKVMMDMESKYPGLRGIESMRRGESVTIVKETSIGPDPAVIRERVGSAFPQFGTEEVVATVTVPEDEQNGNKKLTADIIDEFLRLGVKFAGMKTKTEVTNVKVIRRMNVTDREALFEAVNDGLIPKSALKSRTQKKVEVRPLHPTPVAKKTA